MKKGILLSLVVFFMSFFAKAEGELDLRQVLESRKNDSVIDIPHGTYILDLQINQNAYSFTSKKDIIIDGNNSRIICNRQSQAFYFSNCENVTFKNLTIEYDPPCASQGTIVELSADKRTWTVELQANYPTQTVDENGKGGGISKGRILAYDKDNRLLKQNMETLSTNAYTKIDNNTIRFRIDNDIPTDDNSIQIGDFVAFEVFAEGWYAAHTIILDNCKNMKMENVTVYDSNCFSFLEYDCEKTHYYRCTVTRKLEDSKYGDRLRAGIADMLHSKFAKIGPQIEDCILEYAGDDAIAINGNFYPVYKADEANKSIYILTTESIVSNVRIKKDDKFICVNNDGSIRGSAIVSGVVSASATSAERTATFNKLSNILNSGNYQYGVRILLKEWIEGAGTGDVAYSNDRVGSGFRITNNTVGGNRSRAILIKASDGLIEGNLIRNSAMSGIALAPEFYWMEAGSPSNVIIRNNTIINCMFDRTMWGTSQFAALVVVAEAPNGQFGPAGSLNTISIYDNIITDCPYPAVGLTSIDKVYFKGNMIIKSSWDRQHGVGRGVTHNRDLYRINVTNFSSTNDWTDITNIKKPRVDDDLMYLYEGNIIFPSLSQTEKISLELFDLTGKKISSVPQINGNTLSMAGYPKGIYLVRLLYNGKYSVKKIIKE